MALIQSLIFLIGWIHLQHSCRICLLECFIVFKLKNKRPFCGQIRQLYAYVANEFTQNVSRLMLETAKPSDSVATFYCIKEI